PSAVPEIWTRYLHDALPSYGRGRGRTMSGSGTGVEMGAQAARSRAVAVLRVRGRALALALLPAAAAVILLAGGSTAHFVGPGWEDRKSTRLNSSHVKIAYAV